MIPQHEWFAGLNWRDSVSDIDVPELSSFTLPAMISELKQELRERIVDVNTQLGDYKITVEDKEIMKYLQERV